LIAENLSTLKIHKLTQAQYNRELAAGNIDPSALYLTPDTVISVDATLSIAGAPADSKAVGDAISQLSINKIGITNGTITLAQGDWYLGDDGLYHNDENDGTCTGVTADATVIVTPDPSNTDGFNWYIECGVRCVTQGEETLFFVADTDPNKGDDIVVNYTVFA
jgi:hypothetical protein